MPDVPNSIAPAAKFMRGAIPTPRHQLLSATPHVITSVTPAMWAIVPKKLSFWYNNQYGDCVTASEAYAKACCLRQDGSELFITDQTVYNFAAHNGLLNGADLLSVIRLMQTQGFSQDGTTYKDGDPRGVDYSNEAVLENSLSIGPVKIAIDANALPSGAGNHSGWFALSRGNYGNTDHCVELSGFGPADYLYEQLQIQLPSGVKASERGRLLFTWNTIGFVTQDWLMGTCTEAWLRTPTTLNYPNPVPIPSGWGNAA